MQKLPLLVAALTVCTAVTLPASAQVYKWKDEQGRTVVSDKPRPGGVKEDLVVAVQELPEQATAPGKSLADQELGFRQRQQQRRDAATKAEADKRAAELRAKACMRAQNQLKSLESGRRFRVTDERGVGIVMDDEMRQKAIEDKRAYIRQKECSG